MSQEQDQKINVDLDKAAELLAEIFVKMIDQRKEAKSKERNYKDEQ